MDLSVLLSTTTHPRPSPYFAQWIHGRMTKKLCYFMFFFMFNSCYWVYFYNSCSYCSYCYSYCSPWLARLRHKLRHSPWLARLRHQLQHSLWLARLHQLQHSTWLCCLHNELGHSPWFARLCHQLRHSPWLASLRAFSAHPIFFSYPSTQWRRQGLWLVPNFRNHLFTLFLVYFAH